MKLDSVCPDCGAQRESSPNGDYCPACYLLVGLEGIDAPIDESLDEVAEKAGDSIGRFELLEEIGEGGFGVVFRALQNAPVRRTLALKVIKPGMDSREIVARFEAERQALALMDHPHIAKVYDAGTTALGRPFFVMELVEGLPLTTFCDKNQLSIRQRLELFVKICNGVQHAHQKGIIHRDLKPSNILVHTDDSGAPSPKIIDFGVAKAIGIELTEQTFFTLFGRLVGTPEYMSPEQAQLNALDVDTRSDIYSLGVVLHELLTGCVPLSREQLTKNGYDEMRRMIREQEPPKSSSCFAALNEKKRDRIAGARKTDSLHLGRRLRHDLDWIVMKAIEKDRSRRYETAQGLGIDIERYLNGLPVNASPPSRAYRVGKFVRRHRAGVIVSSLTILALIACIIAGFTAYRTLRLAHRETLIEGASSARLSGESGWRDKSLRAIEEASKILIDEDLRNEALACLAGTDMKQTASVFAISNPPASITFDSGHQLCAYVRDQSSIEILGRSNSQTLKVITREHSLEGCRLLFGGEDSQYLIIATHPSGPGPIEIIEWKTGTIAIPSTQLSDHALDLLPNNKGIAIGSPDNKLAFLDWNGLAIRKPISLKGRPRLLSLRPGTNQVALCLENTSEDRTISYLRVKDYQTNEIIANHRDLESVQLAWNPTGRFLAVGGSDGALSIIEPEPGDRKPINQLDSHLDEIKKIAWSTDGRLLASASADWEIRLWDGRHGSLISTNKARAGNFSFSPDDKYLGPVTWDRKLFELEIQHSIVCQRAIGHPGREFIAASAWDKHGSAPNHFSLTLATAGNDGVTIWNRNGKELTHFENDVTSPKGLAFSKSSLYIAGEEGIKRRDWRIGPNAKHEMAIHFRTAKKFTGLKDCGQIVLTPDESHLIVATASGVYLADTNNNSTPSKLPDTTADTYLAIDSEGQWLATTSKQRDGVQIWSLPDGILLKVLPAAEAATLAFSPVFEDGRVLFATGDSSSYRFWDPKNGWEENEKLMISNHMADIPGRMVFSPRGTAFAISHERDLLKVLDPRSMKILTRPNFDKQWPLAISLDGMLISTEGRRNGKIFIWDFTAVRKEFKRLGIDWDMKDFKEVTLPIVTTAERN